MLLTSLCSCLPSCIPVQKSKLQRSCLECISPDIVMESVSTFPIQVRSEAEGGAPTGISNDGPPPITDRTGGPHQSDGCAQWHVYVDVFFHSDHHLNAHQCHRWPTKARRRHSIVGKVRTARISCILASQCGRLFSDTIKDTIAELRKDEEARIHQCVHPQLFLSGGH